MPAIHVDPDDLRVTGGEVARAASALSGVGGLARAASAGAEDPPNTADALRGLGERWAAGAESLNAELEALAMSTDAAAFFYAQTDQRSMGGA